jgi:DNA-binding phage protein
VNETQNMRLKNYKVDLQKRLRDPGYATEYLAQVLAEKDSAAFLIALKDVDEAVGGTGRGGLKEMFSTKVACAK